MRRLIWPISIAIAGLVFVSGIFTCAIRAIPDRGFVKDWPMYGSLLLLPYGIAAIACGVSRRRTCRLFAAAVVGFGMLMAGLAVKDAWPTFNGNRAPDMPDSAMFGAMLLVFQFGAAIVAFIIAINPQREGGSVSVG